MSDLVVNKSHPSWFDSAGIRVNNAERRAATDGRWFAASPGLSRVSGESYSPLLPMYKVEEPVVSHIPAYLPDGLHLRLDVRAL